MSPVFPNSIEVFDLAENQDTLSPVELDPEKLAHKFKEVCANLKFLDAFRRKVLSKISFLLKAPDQTRRDPGGDPAVEEEGEASGFLSLATTKHCIKHTLCFLCWPKTDLTLPPPPPATPPPTSPPAGSCGAGQAALADGAHSAGAKYSRQQREDGEAGRLLDGGAVAVQGKKQRGNNGKPSPLKSPASIGDSPAEPTDGFVMLWLCWQAVDEHLKETQAQYQTLERKYSKAKRLVKEYQQK